jgi:hypothetical protein
MAALALIGEELRVSASLRESSSFERITHAQSHLTPRLIPKSLPEAALRWEAEIAAEAGSKT